MSDLRLQLTRDWPLWFLALAGLAAIGLSASFYLRSGHELSRRYFAVLVALRVAAIAVLVLFIFRPILYFQHRLVEKPMVSVAIDRSGSMSIRDGEGTAPRLDQVKAALGSHSRFVRHLEDDFDVAFYEFASDTKPLNPGRLALLLPDGTSTSIAQAVSAASHPRGDRRAEAIVLISDGIDNSGKPIVPQITQQGMVVHCIGVGATAQQQLRNIAVVNVEHDRYITVDNVAQLTVHVRSSGYSDQARLVLTEEGRTVAEKQIILQGATKANGPADTQVETLSFTPEKIGQFSYEVSIAPREDERIVEDNRYGFSMIVTSPKIKVLYVEGAPRPEYKFLKRTLEQDPNIELLALVQTRKGVFYKQGQIKGIDIQAFPNDLPTLKKFNVVILGDIDRTFFTTPQLQNVQAMVRDGGGFLMLGGKSSFGPGGYSESPLADVLPVRLSGKGDPQENTRFRLRLTPEGAAHPIFAGTSQFFSGAQDQPATAVPELEGCNVVRGKKPAATVLAVNPSRKDPEGNDLIVAAIAPYGSGRAMAFTADSTHYWWQQLQGLGRDTPYVRFWGQTIRWLANEAVKQQEQGKGVTAYADKLTYEPGEAVSLFARARGEQGLATNDAIVSAAIRAEGQPPINLQLNYEPGSTGEYHASFEPPAPGDYTVAVAGKLNDQPLGEAQVKLRVGKPNLEFDRLDLDEDSLKQIAQATGGQYVTLARIDDLAEKLLSQQREKRIQRKVYLWNGPLMFLAFLALMSSEWVLRKRRQLP